MQKSCLTDKLKIAIFADELAPGSAPKLIGQPIRELSKMGHICEGVALVNNKLQKKFPKVYNYHLKDVKIRYLSEEMPRWLGRIDFKFPGFSFFSLHHILSFLIAPLVIKKKEYDIVIAHCQYSSFAAWGLKLFRKIPYLLLVWDPSTYMLEKVYRRTWLRFFYPILHIFAFFLDKLSAKGARALITSGRLHHQRFRDISKKPLEILYPGCFSSNRFIPYAQREKAILTYDRWDIGNKPHIFLDLLEKIDREIKLKIGGFWYSKRVKADFFKEIKKKGLEERIELLGPLNEKKILDLCSKVILHIHPNEEAFGMQTLEAAACGCTVIIPKGSGVTDLFEHSIHGYFPEKRNTQQLIDYTNKVFKDIKRAEEMGRKAQEVAKNYSWAGYAKRLEEIITKYVHERD